MDGLAMLALSMRISSTLETYQGQHQECQGCEAKFGVWIETRGSRRSGTHPDWV